MPDMYDSAYSLSRQYPTGIGGTLAERAEHLPQTASPAEAGVQLGEASS